MRKQWNAHTGTWYEEDYDATTDSIIIHTKQDTQPVLDYAKAQRNSGVNDKVGEFAHYAIIPAIVQVQMRQKGIDINNKRHYPRVFKEIETNYQYLKTTNLKHSVRH